VWDVQFAEVLVDDQQSFRADFSGAQLTLPAFADYAARSRLAL
jgi:hypothetical protein